jgi:hypothetical protein
MFEQLRMTPGIYFDYRDFSKVLLVAYKDLCAEEGRQYNDAAIERVHAWLDYAFAEVGNGALQRFNPKNFDDYLPFEKKRRNHFESSLGILLERIIQANDLKTKFIEVQISW